MTTINLNSDVAKKLAKLTTAQLKGKLKKAEGEEKSIIEALIAQKEPAKPAAAPKADKAAPKAEEKTTEQEIAETEEALEKAKAAKNANEVKKLTRKLEVLKEDASSPAAAPKAEKAKKEPKPKAEKSPKKTAETAVTSSKDKAIQARIDGLNKLIGEDLKNELLDLKMEGIDVEFLVILNKGDEVEFEAANNSPYKGQKLKGIVVGISDLDSAGRKYCRVKVDKFKSTFQKSQTSITRLDLPEEKPAKPAKADKKETAPKADKADKAAPKADKATDKKETAPKADKAAPKADKK